MIIKQFKPNADMMFNLRDVKRILAVDIVGGEPTIWALTDPINGGDRYTYRAMKNSDSLPAEMIDDYVATMIAQETNAVWHLFGRKIVGGIARKG